MQRAASFVRGGGAVDTAVIVARLDLAGHFAEPLAQTLTRRARVMGGATGGVSCEHSWMVRDASKKHKRVSKLFYGYFGPEVLRDLRGVVNRVLVTGCSRAQPPCVTKRRRRLAVGAWVGAPQ